MMRMTKRTSLSVSPGLEVLGLLCRIGEKVGVVCVGAVDTVHGG